MNLVQWINRGFIGFSMALGMLVGCSPVNFEPNRQAICGDLGEENCIIEPDSLTITTSYTVPSPKVDILFVNDNSGTMNDIQQSMAQRFSHFTNRLNGLNWQIGVTTMHISRQHKQWLGEFPIFEDGNNCDLMPWLNPSCVTTDLAYKDGNLLKTSTGINIVREADSNRQQLFSELIQVEPRGSSDERGIYAATLGLEKNKGSLIRNDSTHVAIVFVSDEDNRSIGLDNGYTDRNGSLTNTSNPNCNPSNLSRCLRPRDRKESLYDIWNGVINTNPNARKTLSAHSLIIKPNDSACLANRKNIGYSDSTYGHMYADMSNDSRSKGNIGSICNFNLGNELSNIGQYIADSTRKDFPLSPQCNEIITDNIDRPLRIKLSGPMGDDIEFRLNFDPLPSYLQKVEVGTNKLTFTPGITPGTKVDITYTCK